MKSLGRRGMGSGEALPLLPDSKGSASEKWMRHFIWSDCPICYHGSTVSEDRYCPKGKHLREAALAEMKAIPKQEKKPTTTVFNPSIEGHK
jgi:hypothetical protein